MKKGIQILIAMFLVASTAKANNNGNLPSTFEANYSYNNAVNFFEKGIEFFVFTNGDFDFDTRFNNRGLRINRNFRGQIRSIGNVFISYDFRGNVTKIGNVFIRYSRGRLTSVGDLRVRYDNWNDPIFYGNVRNYYYNNGIRFNVSFGDVFDYNHAYFNRNDFSINYVQFREDNSYYYYKARQNAKIGKRSKIIKRRKPASFNANRKVVRNNKNIGTYRKASPVNTKRVVTTDRRSNSTVNRGTKNSKRVVTEKRAVTNQKKRISTNKNVESSRKATKRKSRN